MILFEKIKYKNILSAGPNPIEINLNKNKTCLIIGQNGAGKSLLVDAITFALFGKPYRNINKPQLVNTITNKDLLIELWFTIGKKNYKIVRGIKPSIFEIYLNNKLIEQDAAVGDYQEYLENVILKTNYKSFCQIIVLGAASYTKFMNLKTPQRREIIEELLDLKIFSSMNTILKNKVGENNNSISAIEVDKKALQSNIDFINEYTKQANSLKEKDNTHIEYIEKFNKIRDEIFSYQEKYNSALKKYKDLQDTDVNDEKLKKKYNKFISALAVGKINIQSLNKEISFLQSHNNCPTCNQTIDEQFKCERIDSSSNQVYELEGAVKEAEKKIKDIENELEKIKETRNDISLAHNEVSKYKTYLEMSRRRFLDLQREMKNKKKPIILEQNNVPKQKIADLNLQIGELDTKLSELQEEKQILSVAQLLLKDTGIKAAIIKQYVPIINKLINKYLSAMDLFVDFNLDENFNETIRSRFRDSFTFNCLPAYVEVETENGLKTMSWIVKNKYQGKVKSFNTKTGKFEWNRVLNHWCNEKTEDKKWLKIKTTCKNSNKSLVSTQDHQILVADDPFSLNFQYVEAQNSIGKWQVRTEGHKENRLFNREQMSAIIGMMLGDGSISKFGRFTVTHSFKQKDYLMHIINLLNSDNYEEINPDINSFNNSVQYRTTIKQNAQFKYLHTLLYTDNEGKKCNKNISKIIPMIDEISLAYWYMDDGSLHVPSNSPNARPSISLCTDSFTLEECNRLREHLYNKFGLISKIYTNKKGHHRICLNVENTEKLVNIIAPYIVECCEYKIRRSNIKPFIKKTLNNERLDFCLSQIMETKELVYDYNKSSTKKYSSKLYDIEVENVHNFVANKSVVHNCFSMGEQSKIDIAILMTFRAISKMRNSASMNILFLDEVFDGALDANSIDALIDILHKSDENNNIFIISHKDQYQDRFENVIRFQKTKNFTTMVKQ